MRKQSTDAQRDVYGHWSRKEKAASDSLLTALPTSERGPHKAQAVPGRPQRFMKCFSNKCFDRPPFAQTGATMQQALPMETKNRARVGSSRP